ncbi:hypothetical protein B0H19DRAFT_1168449 [Mycena capillaripes]|nr:hypothetical protein B0H19DRAFT_1168449 [Mycena capillaripes]
MRGWLPLRGLMGGLCPFPPALRLLLPCPPLLWTRTTVNLRDEVYPNVEQLMRTADLLRIPSRWWRLRLTPGALRRTVVVQGVEAAKPVEGRGAGAGAGAGIVPTAIPFVPSAVSVTALPHHRAPVGTTR